MSLIVVPCDALVGETCWTIHMADGPILDVRHLRKTFPVAASSGYRPGTIVAVDDVSFTLPRGGVLGLVGESGSGKSTIGRLVLRLHEPSGGQVLFDGMDLTTLSRPAMRKIRRRMQMVFQDPYASLNPYQRVRDILAEAFIVQRIGDRRDRGTRIERLLNLVGLQDSFSDRYPHELSGGQRQRVAIARALAVEPDLIVADEAVSALDVSNQAQVINVLMDLRSRFHLSMLFISHNLAVVRNIADSVAVLYLGRVMEIAPVATLFDQPRHPYTIALLSSVPIPDPRVPRQRKVLAGEMPSPLHPPSGCVFRTRCPIADPACKETVPLLRAVDAGHQVACLKSSVAIRR
jgi:oligopeptide/dipeptide ABC transporter ATP-binding protein